MSSRRADKHKRGIHRRFSFDSCRFDIYTDTFMQSPARAPGRKVGLCKGKFNYEEFFHLLGTFNSVMSTCQHAYEYDPRYLYGTVLVHKYIMH